jgi:hypothetical protein
MCAGAEVDGVPVEADQLGEAQARLERDQQQGDVTSDRRLSTPWARCKFQRRRQ